MGLSLPSKSQSFLAKIGLPLPSNTITTYGFYAQSSTGYVKIERHVANRIDYAEYSELPYVDRDGDTLELLVYQKNFNPEYVRFHLCTMGFKGRFEKIDYAVNKLGRDKYQIIFTSPVSASDWLFVQYGEYYENEAGVIALSYPAKQLGKILSDMTKSPKVVLPSLQKALQSYPYDGTLKSLLPVWERKVANLRDNKCFGLCEEQWEYSISADSNKARHHFLKRTKQFLTGYLRKFPKGLHIQEAEDRYAMVIKKLESTRLAA